MASVKERLKARTNQPGENRISHKSATGTANFKIYADNENVRGPRHTRKSVPANKKESSNGGNHTKETQNVKKSQNKHDSPVKLNAKRSALADVSNTRGFFRKSLHDGSKPMVPVGHAIKIASSSRKVLTGKSKANLNGDAGNLHNFKRTAGANDTKASFGNQRAGVQAHPSIHIGRKSLLEAKKVDQENNAISEHKEKYGFSVRCKVGHKVVSQVSRDGNHLWRNRASDGHKLMPQVSRDRNNLWRNQASDGFVARIPKTQNNAGACALLRKPTRPITRGSAATFNSQKGTLKTKRPSVPNKLLSAATISSKRDAEASTSKLAESSVEGTSNSSMKSTCVIAGRKSSRRRRSFTSFLMNGLKMIEKKDENELPSIDDRRNPLEVSEYVDDIYQYYWVTEAQSPCLADYMEIQTEITHKMRGILINWLIEVHFKFDLMQETLYLAVALLDRYLSHVAIKKSEMQLVGLAAVLLASKYEDFWHPRVKDLISISAESYTRDQLLGMEKLILKKLKFRLNSPTPYVFMLRFLKAAQADKKLENLAFYLTELCLMEYEALRFRPSLLCASAIYVARCTLQIMPAWTPLLGWHLRYNESQIRDCAAMTLRLHKAAKMGVLNVTYEKYLRPELGGVAALKPLDKI